MVAGPNSGTIFPLGEGEHRLGREGDLQILLVSQKISKHHCTFLVSDSSVTVKDEKSTNGIYVNGLPVTQKKLKHRDKVTIGEYTFEFRNTERKKKKSRHQKKKKTVLSIHPGNVIDFPSGLIQAAPSQDLPMLSQPERGAVGLPDMGDFGAHTDAIPSNVFEKALWYFERYVMPIFYSLNLKHEWRILSVVFFSFFTLAMLFASVAPLIEANHHTVIKETQNRALFMAETLVRQNQQFIADGQDTRATIDDVMLNAEGVYTAVLLRVADGSYIAPSSKLNERFTTPSREAGFANTYLRAYRKGSLEKSVVANFKGLDRVGALSPLKVYDPALGKNVVKAVALISIDTSLATPQWGSVGIYYSKSIILTFFLAVFLLLILYRLTLKPFEILNEDIDRALKGDHGQIAREFRFSETDSLWDVINAALERVPRGSLGEGDSQQAAASRGITLQEVISLFQITGGNMSEGLVICDEEKRIVYLNEKFEELSGIHSAEGMGQILSEVARDQAFESMVGDLFSRIGGGLDASAEDVMDFAGVNYKLQAMAVGADPVKGYMLFLASEEQSDEAFG